MVKHLLTVACAAAALSASAAEVVDYEIDYSKYSEFPFYKMDYAPAFEDGVMKASNPGSWYQFFVADGISTQEGFTYKVTIKVKSSVAGSFAANMGWGWGDGEQEKSTLFVTTDWAEQTIEYHNVATGNCNVVLQPGGFEGNLEFAWLKVTHEDVSLNPDYQCLIADRLDAQNAENIWDLCAQYAFPAALEAGDYTFKFDVYGLEDGKGSIWGTVGGDPWYGGGDFEIKANAWNAIEKVYAFSGELSVINIVFGGPSNYAGTAIYFDNFSLTKAGSSENLIENSDFRNVAAGNWSRPSYLKYNLYVGNGPDTFSGVGSIESEAAAEPVYYNLQGVRMSQGNLPAGIYVKVVGSKAEKVAIR